MSIPSIRQLKNQLTPRELRLWIEKLSKDRFDSVGQNLRQAAYQAQLLNFIKAMMGDNKQDIKVEDVLVEFGEKEKEQSPEAQKQIAKGHAKTHGKVIE